MSDAKLKALQVADAQRRLSKEQLLTPKLQSSEEEIPSLGGTVVLRTLTYAEREEIRGKAGWQTPQWDEAKFNLLAVAKSLVEPELSLDDIEQLRNINSQVIDELIIKINLINLTGKADEVKKELRRTQNSGSSSS